MGGLLDGFSISASGMTAERLRMDVIAENLANANTTRSADGSGPYRRKEVVVEQVGSSFAAELGNAGGVLGGSHQAAGGVRVADVVPDPSPLRRVYDPGHPDADKSGYVTMPNVQPVTEMVDLITATRGYEANVQALNATKQMLTRAIDILR